MDALGIKSAVLAGYDWGGRAACIVSALWPERVRGLVSGNAYNLQDIAASVTPPRRSRSIVSGTNIIFTMSEAAPVLSRTAKRFAGCCGNYGPRHGRSTMRLTSRARPHSTIRISSR